jgi:cytochrome c biogenesis protein CcmG, thiol:disulfide interchange protein DsbE
MRRSRDWAARASRKGNRDCSIFLRAGAFPAPVLLQMAGQGVQIDAIAIRDRPQDVARFLTRNGNPYQRIGSDVESAVQMSMGSSGVPETFVIDGRGIIRHQHIGDIRAEDVPVIMDALRKAR